MEHNTEKKFIVRYHTEEGEEKEKYFADIEQAIEFQEKCIFVYGLDAEML